MHQLPSTKSAEVFWRGGGAWGLLATTLARASVIALGATVAGVRGPAVIKAAIGGALAVELGVLLFTRPRAPTSRS